MTACHTGFLALALLLAATPLLGQQGMPSTAGGASSNALSSDAATIPTPAPEAVTPAGTNAPVPETATPPALTNIPPAFKARPDTVGISTLGSLGGTLKGKYSVSGRTLKLPVPAATPFRENGWQRSLDFGMNQSKGNSETLRYTLGLDAVRDQDSHLVRLKARAAYGETDGAKDTENAYAGFRHEHLATPKLYTLENLEWNNDIIADLQYRVTAILSPGIRLIRTDTTLLNIELGPGYIEEKKKTTEAGYLAGRAATTLEQIVNTQVLLWGTAEYLPKLADPGIFLANAEAGIASYLTRDLSLKVVYQMHYDSAPVEGKEDTDTVLAAALSLNF